MNKLFKERQQMISQLDHLRFEVAHMKRQMRATQQRIRELDTEITRARNQRSGLRLVVNHNPATAAQ